LGNYGDNPVPPFIRSEKKCAVVWDAGTQNFGRTHKIDRRAAFSFSPRHSEHAMTRSTFLKTAAATVASTSALSAATAESRAYFEIRKYTLLDAEKQTLLENYLRDAAIPALNRVGVRHVGVFLPEKQEDKPVVYVVLHHASLGDAAACADVLDDAALQKAGAGYLGAPANAPVYERVESWLTRGIAGMPTLQMPAGSGGIYQLRIYESHSEKAAKKKIEMFNMGELSIFRRCGLNVVFFGETIIGPRMPNLTYMLAFPDAAAKETAWNTFRSDSEWTKLKTTPGFTDKEIVSHITNLVLVPTTYSQIGGTSAH